MQSRSFLILFFSILNLSHIFANDNTPVTSDQLLNAVTIQTFNSLQETGFRRQLIFSRGRFVNNWGSCNKNSMSIKDCVAIPSYQERDAFLITYDTQHEAEYRYSKPTVEISTDAAKPKIAEYVHKDQKVSFVLQYNCVKQPMFSTSTEVIDLNIPVLPNVLLKTRFTKNCTSSVNYYATLGVIRNGKKVLLPSQNASISVSPTEVITEWFVRIFPPATSLSLGDPIIHASNDYQRMNPTITFNIRGWRKGSKVSRGHDVVFTVLYECFQNDMERAKLIVPMSPWQDLKADIVKSCGGNNPTNLDVGTRSNEYDIIQHGITQPRYNITNTIKKTGDAPLITFSETTHSVKLYLRNSKELGGPGLHIGKMHFTISSSNLSIEATKGKQLLRGNIDNTVGLIAPGDIKEQTLWFQCRGEGDFLVLVSVPILQYRVVEFAFRKKCHSIKSRKAAGWESWWTVVGIEDTLIAAFFLILVCVFLLKRDRIVKVFAYQRLPGGMM